MKPKRRFFRSFLIAFLFSLCLLGSVAAFLYIGYNGQITAKGEASAAVTYTVQNGKLCPADPLTGQPLRLISEPSAQTLSVAVPAPLRLAFSLLEREIDAAVAFWDRMLK